ncbi:uncharacterized protein PG998_010221 [Apiospora kogelbergensis]|uniref:uncharacterized protein n=1 Tax=Apiospora kogelbergensis TaxID=1337665 RepID=UPI00312D4AA8
MAEANQSRRREGFEQNAPGNPAVDKHASFSYEPLIPHVDCIRLLTIEPAELDAQPLVCGLSVVEFGDKPTYEALSYRWGDSDTSQLPLTVDDQECNVGKNLWDALHYLRQKTAKRSIWIDALCINQKDILERNRQLRIMHHIYFRASVVIVWLGAGYSKYHDTVQRMQSRRIQAHQETAPAATDRPAISDLQREQEDAAGIGRDEAEMVEQLYDDEYWRRLWIIQEVGQADSLQVCFGRSAPLKWEAFIHFIRMHNKGSEGPIKLDQLRQSRLTGGYKLRALLSHHRHARCKEPRDKVYGLIGLADDAHRFPMDYAKTLIEVWTDVMHFTWLRGLLPSDEIIAFGALVKFLLMGDQSTPLQQALRLPGAEKDPVVQRLDSNNSNTSVVFEISAAVLGEVGFVGATTTDIVGKLRTVDEWNEKVQEDYSNDVESAGSESRTLIRSLLRQGQTKRL